MLRTDYLQRPIWKVLVIYLCIILNLGNKVYNQILTGTLTQIHIDRACEVFFMTMSFSSHEMPFV